MTAATISDSATQDQNSNPRFEPKDRATAPLRLVMTAPVDASPEDTLKTIFEFDRLTDYLPSIKKVETDFHPNGTPEVRYCSVSGMGKLAEEIVWFDESLGYAYSAQPLKSLPMVNHLGVATVKSDGSGGSLVRWEQYFDWQGWFKPLMMKMMLPKMMKSLGEGLQRDLGSKGSVETKWVG